MPRSFSKRTLFLGHINGLEAVNPASNPFSGTTLIRHTRGINNKNTTFFGDQNSVLKKRSRASASGHKAPVPS